jgi:ATP synthase protein I
MSMRPNQRHPLQAIGLMSAIVSQLVGSILVGIFGGKWIDEKFHTEPVFLIVGLLLGLATGVYAMLRSIRQYFPEE